MDLTVYYRKVKENEQKLSGDWVVVKSCETPDGGKPGVLTEVSRRNAALLLVDGRAELASDGEAKQFRDALREAKAAVDQAEAGRRLQMSLIPTNELRSLKSGNQPTKG
jgi:hypothetical protein